MANRVQSSPNMDPYTDAKAWDSIKTPKSVGGPRGRLYASPRTERRLQDQYDQHPVQPESSSRQKRKKAPKHGACCKHCDHHYTSIASITAQLDCLHRRLDWVCANQAQKREAFSDHEYAEVIDTLDELLKT